MASRELERADSRGGGLGQRLDAVEVGGGERGELGGRKRTAVAALRREQRRTENRQRLEHHSGPLVAQNRANDGPAAGRRRREPREPREQPADGGEVVGSV